jgi:hypothetical protein
MREIIGMPQQCIAEGKELVNAHGYDKALEILDERMKAKTQEHALVDIRTDTQLKIDLACKVDFLSQTKQAVIINK